MGIFSPKTIVTFSCLALVLGVLGCGLNEPSSEPDPRRYPKQNSHLGHAGDSGNTPGWRGKPASRIHEGLLSEWAFRFDCYFTIEEQCPKGGPSRVLGVHLAEAFDPADRTAMLEGLRKALPRFSVEADKVSPVIIRIVDKHLIGGQNYALARATKATFAGTPNDLLLWLGKNQVNVSVPTHSDVGMTVSFGDQNTPLRIRAYTGSVRRLLMDYLPLSDYQRVIWSAESSEENGKLETVVRFRGIKKRENPHLYRRGLEALFQTPSDFATGEGAYIYNTGKRDQIPAALRFIDDHMKPGASRLQVRWAMLFLGREKAQAGIPVLLRHIDYLYTPWGVVREAYPAVKALAQVGPEGAKACLEQLQVETHPLRQQLMCQVLLDQQGPAESLKTLKAYSAKFTDASLRNRLAAAEAVLRDLSKE